MLKTFLEDTTSGDVAVHTPKLGLDKKCKCCGRMTEELEELEESAVGQVGRTDAKSALTHLTPELKKRFRKLLKDVGGKTVMRYLLADEPLQEKLSTCQAASDALMRLQDSTKSKRLKTAIDEVLDIMDTDC